MWLPGPIYESLPYCYVLIGCLFLTGTLYIGLAAPGASLYIACGLISIVSGAIVFMRRLIYRSAMEGAQNAETA